MTMNNFTLMTNDGTCLEITDTYIRLLIKGVSIYYEHHEGRSTESFCQCVDRALNKLAKAIKYTT